MSRQPDQDRTPISSTLAEIADHRAAAANYRIQAEQADIEAGVAYSQLVDQFMPADDWVEDGPMDPYRRANAALAPAYAEIRRLEAVAAGLEAKARRLEDQIAGGAG
jgi:hypothetical protein